MFARPMQEERRISPMSRKQAQAFLLHGEQDSLFRFLQRIPYDGEMFVLSSCCHKNSSPLYVYSFAAFMS